MVSLAETPLTGKPDAGNPPVRFDEGDQGLHLVHTLLVKMFFTKPGAIANRDVQPVYHVPSEVGVSSTGLRCPLLAVVSRTRRRRTSVRRRRQ